MPFDREQMKVAELAAQSVLIGASSWQHAGWLNQNYTPDHYEDCGMVTGPFERDGSAEYAEVFKTVSP